MAAEALPPPYVITAHDKRDWWLAAATILDTVRTAVIFHLVELGVETCQDDLLLSQLERIGKGKHAKKCMVDRGGEFHLKFP
ncbi:hypothetical protein PTTW11_07181 [Pyrenophora teres f. teres]|uniref:Uncharacterized protein n=1 Tax=Pyrenophora teres f. teres TaxID=97479 RepID=A0A6S6W9Z4_9PLEO|nr:hypothetical protein PTTW11_07181 [Pyrenophora teres f. teres]